MGASPMCGRQWCMANVAPTDRFAITAPDAPKLEPKHFAADGSPIAQLGSLVAEGVSDEGTVLKIDFDLGKVTAIVICIQDDIGWAQSQV